MIPPCAGKYATLPPGRHKTALDEIHQRFVVEAPFRERRELIHGALSLYSQLIASVFSRAKLWVDGGFVTHKTWAEPEDADVVVIVPVAEFARALDDKNLPLWSIASAAGRVSNQTVSTSKLHPMGGLLDAFVVPEGLTANLDLWDDLWSKVRDENGNEVPGETKGYLEVEV